jgi:hypothetical protein
MDLNMMMREQARNGLQAQLDAAVTNGDTEAARKVAADIAKLEVSTAPKAAPYTSDDIKAELNKQDWFGVDPKKSAKAMEFGKTMDLSKFATAAAFAAAVVKAVDEEFKPAAAAGTGEDDEEENDPKDKDGGKDDNDPARKLRRSDGPGEGDATQRTRVRTSSGPWTKLADAPADVQKEIKRSVDKFVPARAPKEQRDSYIAKALDSHFAIFQRNKGKK